mmetsp:Transcript_48204/g.121436  ORF Transcript_48204/g.121436 Transcript_48204/m.121436 type:complete len:290 (+) Transcript_48204:3-872(+)
MQRLGCRLLRYTSPTCANHSSLPTFLQALHCELRHVFCALAQHASPAHVHRWRSRLHKFHQLVVGLGTEICPLPLRKALLRFFVHHEESAQMEVARRPFWMGRNDCSTDAIEGWRWQCWNVVEEEVKVLNCQRLREVNPDSGLRFLMERWQILLRSLHNQPEISPVHIERQSGHSSRGLVLTREHHLEVDTCGWNSARDGIHDCFPKRKCTVPDHAGLEFVQRIEHPLEVHFHGLQAHRCHALLNGHGAAIFERLLDVWAVQTFLGIVQHPLGLQSKPFRELHMVYVRE